MTELNTFNTKDTFYIKCLFCIQNVIKSEADEESDGESSGGEGEDSGTELT